MLNIRTSDLKDLYVNSEHLLFTDTEDKTINLDFPSNIIEIAINFGKFYNNLPKKLQDKIIKADTYDKPKKSNQEILDWFTTFKHLVVDIQTLLILIKLSEDLNITPLGQLCCYILATKISGAGDEIF